MLLEKETLDETDLREFREKIQPTVREPAVVLSPHPVT
jgi:hypothetical protein